MLRSQCKCKLTANESEHSGFSAKCRWRAKRDGLHAIPFFFIPSSMEHLNWFGFLLETDSGRPRFGSVRLRFGDGTVRAVLVFGSGGSSLKRDFRCFSTVWQERTVPVSVPGKRFRRFRFRFRFREKRFRRFRFPVPVRFLSHPADCSCVDRLSKFLSVVVQTRSKHSQMHT